MNYSELKQMWIEWSHRPDLTGTTTLDEIEQITRARLGRDLRLIENTETETLLIPTQGTDLDPRIKEIQRLRDAKGYPMQYISPANFYKISTGAPYMFTVEGGKIFLDVTNDDGIEMELVSFKEPLPMVNDDDTNPVLTQWPNIYLYAGLTQIMVFTQNMEMESMWEQKYRSEIAAANEQAQRLRIGPSPSIGD